MHQRDRSPNLSQVYSNILFCLPDLPNSALACASLWGQTNQKARNCGLGGGMEEQLPWKSNGISTKVSKSASRKDPPYRDSKPSPLFSITCEVVIWAQSFAFSGSRLSFRANSSKNRFLLAALPQNPNGRCFSLGFRTGKAIFGKLSKMYSKG